MAMVGPSLTGVGYALNNNDDRETGGFEFTRRKRWPHLLLQELVGSALFCLRPVPAPSNGYDGPSGSNSSGLGWKMTYVSPSIVEMTGHKVSDMEGRDFFELVYAADHPQLQILLSSLLRPPSHPSLPHADSDGTMITSSSSSTVQQTPRSPGGMGRSQTTYIRILTTETANNRQTSRDGSRTKSGPVVWEIRAHATGLDGPGSSPSVGFGMGGGGTVVPRGLQDENTLQGKAVWVMGRRLAENGTENDGNAQSLDAFLELKLENEKLREELRELQLDFDSDPESSYMQRPLDPSPTKGHHPHPSFNPELSDSTSSEQSDESDSEGSSPEFGIGVRAPHGQGQGQGHGQGLGVGQQGQATIKGEGGIKPARPGRPPKDPSALREKKRSKMAIVPRLAGGSGAGRGESAVGPNGGGPEGEGLHVCVTCGRTDSPEWRKGPLGPKTLCNACGLRWAKRNSAQPSRKERKAAATFPKKLS